MNPEKYITIRTFARIMKLNRDEKELMHSKMSGKSTRGLVKRENRDGTFYYKETDLLNELEVMKLNADYDIPADCISVRDYIKQHPELLTSAANLSKKLSDWARAGRIRRYRKNGRLTNQLYHLRDIENALSKGFKMKPRKHRTDGIIYKTYKPGIFVRLWRWLFGYNN